MKIVFLFNLSQTSRMNIKFLFFTHAIFVIAHNVSRSNHHRQQLYSPDRRQISSHDKNDSKPIIMKGNNKRSQLQEFKKDRMITGKHIKKDKETIIPWNLSKESDRLEFHVQGHEGPQTYIFGFDTGYGKNRQYRLEERHRDGTIKGQYGYYDAKGKLRTVRYMAKPFEGYTEVHHESNIPKLTN